LLNLPLPHFYNALIILPMQRIGGWVSSVGIVTQYSLDGPR
jgi:hypothetical protein